MKTIAWLPLYALYLLSELSYFLLHLKLPTLFNYVYIMAPMKYLIGNIIGLDPLSSICVCTFITSQIPS